MIRVFLFLDYLLGFYVFILLAAAILSWLIAFDVVNVRNNLVRSLVHALSALTDPVLAPLRRFIPPVGGLDLTVLVLFIIIQFVRVVIIPEAADFFR